MELNWYELPIYILRKHVKETGKMLTSETYPLLPYEHQDLVDKLEEMVKNDDKTIVLHHIILRNCVSKNPAFCYSLLSKIITRAFSIVFNKIVEIFGSMC